MRCCVVYKEDYPWDVRVEKIAKSLCNAGHDVTIVCRNLDQKQQVDVIDGIAIRRLPKTTGLPIVIQKLVNLPLWFNPFWLFAIFRATRGSTAGIIVVRDLPLMFSGILIGKLRQAKVIFDMAECYPEMYATAAQFGRRTMKGRLLKSPRAARLYENAALKLVDHILVMIEESRDRLIALGVPPQRITIVSNTPPKNKFADKTATHDGSDLHIVYVGFLTRIRGLDILIRAIRIFLDTPGVADNSIRFDIVGKGTHKASLQMLVKELDLESQVIIHGWLDHDEVASLMDQANIGALTYRVCGHWNHTIPNKIFDYMLAGLPVLATEVIPIARIITAHDCGLVCRDQDPADVAEKLLLLRDPALRQRLGNNGNAAIQALYNWEQDEQRLHQVAAACGPIVDR